MHFDIRAGEHSLAETLAKYIASSYIFHLVILID